VLVGAKEPRLKRARCHLREGDLNRRLGSVNSFLQKTLQTVLLTSAGRADLRDAGADFYLREKLRQQSFCEISIAAADTELQI
jgi:hypothetical protein